MVTVRWQSSLDEKQFVVQIDGNEGVTVVLPTVVEEKNRQEGTARTIMSIIQKARSVLCLIGWVHAAYHLLLSERRPV